MDCKKISLKYGARGDQVAEVQRCLQKKGYYKNYSVDGDYVKYTVREVKRFQKDHGLKEDGWFAFYTCKKLNCEQQKQTPKGKWTLAVQNASKKTINTAVDLWNALPVGGAYSLYYNDKLLNTNVLGIWGKAVKVNCTDIAQLMFRILKELKYDVRFVRSEVKCSNGKWFGHVYCEYKESTSTKWIKFDASGRLELGNNRKLGELVCRDGEINRTINPAWLLKAADYTN